MLIFSSIFSTVCVAYGFHLADVNRIEVILSIK